MKYETIIGLEVHTELNTKSKMFCSCKNESLPDKPNKNICPICLGYPGTLPVPNEEAIKKGVLMALALSCNIPEKSKFDRKSYFYPDLPKNYQISQYDAPIGKNGCLEIEVGGIRKTIRINRVHLEEDAGKLVHPSADYSLVDFNRAGTPLLEIVSEAEISSPEEAKIYLQTLQSLIKYLGVSSADMEKGQLRCDANISLRPERERKLFPKTEIKNMNSFQGVERALKYEVERQKELHKRGNRPERETTRGWDDRQGETAPQRTKETSEDYRYFPEPDIPPLRFSKEFISKIKNMMSETAPTKKERFIKEYGLNEKQVETLVKNKRFAEYFENTISELEAWAEAENIEGANLKKAVTLGINYLLTELIKILRQKKMKFEDLKLSPENFAEFVKIVFMGEVHSSGAQKLLLKMVETGADPSNIIQEEGLKQESGEKAVSCFVEEVIKENPGPAEDYRTGKENAIKFLMGRVMTKSKGRANPEIALKILKIKLKNNA